MQFCGGRLCVDFVNAPTPNSELSWEHLIDFLESPNIVSAERGTQLLSLPQSDPQAAEALLLKGRRLGSALRKLFTAMLRKQRISGEWTEPGHDILRIPERHDQLANHARPSTSAFVAPDTD